MNIKDFKASLPYLFEAQLTGFVWGHAGIGKSSIVKKYAEEMGYHFFPLYLGTQSDLGDVLGLADFKRDAAGNAIATTFATPDWLRDTVDYCNSNPESGAIIFLDEFNRARRDVLNGMFSLALDKTFHTLKLPENCHVIAAGNPPTDEYYVTDVNETALMARFVHIKLEPSFDEWHAYAKANNFERSLVSFFQEQPGLLEDRKSEFELPVKVDRRSVERVNRLFQIKTPDHILNQLMHGILGLERTVAYQQHIKNMEKPLTGDEILNGSRLEHVVTWSNPNNIVASMLGVTCDNLYETLASFDKQDVTLTDSQSENLMGFFRAMPKDVWFALIGKLIKAEIKCFKAFQSAVKYEPELISMVKQARGIA